MRALLNLSVFAFLLVAIWQHNFHLMIAVIVAWVAGFETGSKTLIKIIKKEIEHETNNRPRKNRQE